MTDRSQPTTPGAEQRRLDPAAPDAARWKWWGPYLAARQWGTVREDYSADGDAWDVLPPRPQPVPGLPVGRGRPGRHLRPLAAPVLRPRPVERPRPHPQGAAVRPDQHRGQPRGGRQGVLVAARLHAHPLVDALALQVPPGGVSRTASLCEESRRRDRSSPEYELLDTGVFDDDRYFDVTLTYAKAGPDDICIVVDCANRGPDPAPLHVLPTLWFRNTWSWGRDDRHPRLAADCPARSSPTTRPSVVSGWRSTVTRRRRCCSVRTRPTPSGCGARRTARRFRRTGSTTTLSAARRTVNPGAEGTKAAAWYRLDGRRRRDRRASGCGSPTRSRRPRPSARRSTRPWPPAERRPTSSSPTCVARRRRRRARPQSSAGPSPGCCGPRSTTATTSGSGWRATPSGRRPTTSGRTAATPSGAHLYNADIISMPDEWEYPWYAAWDLAFHMIPMAFVDPHFAKEQLILFCREWFMHPNGQLPAYEWDFDDVNPPVHAWAAWRVYKIDAKNTGVKDYEFLERVFHKLLINFSWWVNRKDADGQQRVRRRLPGPRQHRRVRPLRAAAERRPPGAVRRHQLDGDVLPQHARPSPSSWPTTTAPTRTSPPSSSSTSSPSPTP